MNLEPPGSSIFRQTRPTNLEPDVAKIEFLSNFRFKRFLQGVASQNNDIRLFVQLRLFGSKLDRSSTAIFLVRPNI